MIAALGHDCLTNNDSVTIKCLLDALHHQDHQTINHYSHLNHEHHHQHRLTVYFEGALEMIDSFVGLIVFAAVILATINVFLLILNANLGTRWSVLDPLHSLHGSSYKKEGGGQRRENSLLGIRVILGEQIAMALGLLVASDILETVLKSSHDYDLLDVMKMGFVAVVRTGLAYFLSKEIKELEEESSEKHQKKKRKEGVAIVEEEEEEGRATLSEDNEEEEDDGDHTIHHPAVKRVGSGGSSSGGSVQSKERRRRKSLSPRHASSVWKGGEAIRRRKKQL